ncbi:Diaminopimelate epimerase-like protein [Coniophora puteana RWD-64-598 SS2]|uniref:Diaminopimelate epimerase-like protein n=1 Tax=Coniophora puteana (strain RWD-64-598) TaxID=741705 RepID=A0A5M3M8G1_CONPW|nr:Diaminopimelate epimerase-like protein [Coniophora puteana RWD-64-598 SS2]EIW75333.1 Diaminopimelate epimerase-like protein [Coniophora puteana RWD-64-598 SS2]
MSSRSLTGTPVLTGNAFTRSTFGGNPAAVVLLPDADNKSLFDNTQYPEELTLAWTSNFAQPMTAFIGMSGKSGLDDGEYAIRYSTTKHEPPLCGHATLVAAGVLFASQKPSGDEKIPRTVRFRTRTDVLITVRENLSDGGDPWYEMEIPAGEVEPVSDETRTKVTSAVAKALGLSEDKVPVKEIWVGAGPMDHFGIIVLNDDEKLEGRVVDPEPFKATPYVMNVLTTATPSSNTDKFQSRSFAPNVGIPEDPVCGAAHTLLTPYWSALMGNAGQEMTVRQVSSRGGDLKVTWDRERGIVKLTGQVALTSRGELLG